jgi:hypothetical protein
MRTSFRHQSEAQPPNGPLTAATSPDTPSTCPATQSVSRKCAGSTFPPPLPLLPGLLALLLKASAAQRPVPGRRRTKMRRRPLRKSFEFGKEAIR